MPIDLPSGIMPTIVPRTEDQVLTDGVRRVSWRWELLDRQERLIGDLDGVQLAGSEASWSAASSVKGSGQITVTGDQGIDELTARLRPWCRIDGIDRDLAAGVWLPAAPAGVWSEKGWVREVSLLDKLTVLDRDEWRDNTGESDFFTADAGANVLQLVRDLIVGAGESAATIDPAGGPVLSSPFVGEVKQSRLQLINRLLDLAGYFSLSTDMAGQYRATPYVRPQDRPVEYDLLGPFTVGPRSVMAPDMQHVRDVTTVPNVFTCRTRGDSETEGLRSTVVNDDPGSPFSTVNRGTISRSEDVEAIDQATLDAMTARKLAAATSVTSKVTVRHLWMPKLRENSVVRLINPDAGLELLCTVTNTSLPYDTLGVCESVLQEVIL